MKLSFKSKPKSRTKKTVLFVCVENAGRSQMAEAFFRKYAPSEYEATSAGTHHTSQINPLVVQIMKDVGIDITNRKPKEMIEDMIRNATKIVNMGCMDKDFPTLFVHNVVDWGIEDQKGKPIEKMKEIRDEIERRVKKVVEEMKREEIE
jgi:arsenate reductase (thioredoxin)